MKGIILAGGKGTRLSPLTMVLSKQLLAVYDKPMIYYPISLLMLLDVSDILLISTEEHLPMFRNLFGDGTQLGINISYSVQSEPKGIAEAFIIGNEFIGNENVCLILGDNLFYGQDLHQQILTRLVGFKGALIFGYQVKNPNEFGVVEFDSELNVISIEEKPNNPKSNYAVPGLYFYDNSVKEKVLRITPSKRGELEITSINQLYMEELSLKIQLLGRGTAWLDTGSPESILSAAQFVEVIQKRQGLSIACLEEIAWRKGFIDLNQLESLSVGLINSDYGNYIKNIVNKEKAKLK